MDGTGFAAFAAGPADDAALGQAGRREHRLQDPRGLPGNLAQGLRPAHPAAFAAEGAAFRGLTGAENGFRITTAALDQQAGRTHRKTFATTRAGFLEGSFRQRPGGAEGRFRTGGTEEGTTGKTHVTDSRN